MQDPHLLLGQVLLVLTLHLGHEPVVGGNQGGVFTVPRLVGDVPLGDEGVVAVHLRCDLLTVRLLQLLELVCVQERQQTGF
jgi:hypothetical protein